MVSDNQQIRWWNEMTMHPGLVETSNPWADLPHEPPYVLASDRPYLDVYNATLKADDDDHRIAFDLPPGPYQNTWANLCGAG